MNADLTPAQRRAVLEELVPLLKRRAGRERIELAETEATLARCQRELATLRVMAEIPQ